MKRKFIINSSTRKTQRQYLRNKTTQHENLLWQYLRKKQLGYWFKRQVSIGPYFVDFYCPQKRLAIELDGNQHLKADQPKYDAYRTEYLNGLNIEVMRFRNQENIGKIVEKIKLYLQPLSP